MRPTKMVLACLVISAAAVVPMLAQEGHPLKGSWLGDFGPSRTDRTPVFIVMDWDGKALTGMLNPGTENIPLKSLVLNAPVPPPPAAGGRGGGQGGGGGRGGGGGGAAAGAAPAGGAAPAAGAAAGGGGQGGRGGQGGGAAAGAAPAGGAAPAAGAAAGGGGQGGRGGQGGGAAAGAAPAGGAAPAAGAAAGGGGQGGRGQGGGAPATPPPPQDWIVRFEADAKDKAGNVVRYVVDGKIENLGLYNRSIVGTWTSGNVKGDFRLTRQ